MIVPTVLPPCSTTTLGPTFPTTANPTKDSSFEGLQKSLHVHFFPLNATASLRELSHSQINSILDAAKCTELSILRNDHMDAYLLSGSSLFVADHFIGFKTNATANLMQALPVILELASAVECAATRVQFSQVMHNLAKNQVFPPTSFYHDVAFLDSQLGVRGTVTSLGESSNGLRWNLYSATFPEAAQGLSSSAISSDISSQDSGDLSPSLLQDGLIDNNSTGHRIQRAPTLEICMHELDPSVIAKLSLGDEHDVTGSDDLKTGMMAQTGISTLLSTSDVVDGFSFESGYSINALAPCGNYTTINIELNEGSSYVSYETSVCHLCPATLVARVVRMFAPRRFTVSSTPAPGATEPERPYLPVDVLCKLLGDKYAVAGMGLGVDPLEQCTAVAFCASTGDFELIDPDTARDDSETHKGLFAQKSDSLQQHPEKKLAQSQRQLQLQHEKCELWPDVDAPKNATKRDSVGATGPTVVLDFGRVERNIARLRGLVPGRRPTLRYSVHCGADPKLLMLLRELDFYFKAGGREGLEQLEAAGIESERITLADPALSARSIDLFERVSRVVVDTPVDSCVATALWEAGVGVELENDMAVQSAGKKLPIVGVRYQSGISSDQVHLMSERDFVVDGGKEMSAALAIAGDRVMADVGRDVLAEAVSVEMTVIGRRVHEIPSDKSNIPGEDGNRTQAEGTTRMIDYFIDDGMYGALGEASLRRTPVRQPRVLQRGNTKHATGSEENSAPMACWSTIWGPTCDAIDRVWQGWLIELDVGAKLLFDDIGADARAMGTDFNGYSSDYSVRFVRSK